MLDGLRDIDIQNPAVPDKVFGFPRYRDNNSRDRGTINAQER